MENDFEQASVFLNQFHSNVSRSLDIILEEESEEVEQNRSTKQIRKTETISCLTMMANSENSFLPSPRITTSTASDENDSWGFGLDESMNMVTDKD